MSSVPALEAVNALQADAKPLFLSRLGFFIAQTARAAYFDQRMPTDALLARRFRAVNEMIIVVFSELTAALNKRDGRSNGDLLVSLRHLAATADRTAELDWALKRALQKGE